MPEIALDALARERHGRPYAELDPDAISGVDATVHRLLKENRYNPGTGALRFSPALGNEGDHTHHASAAGTDEWIDLVHPANELGPSAAKGGQRGGRGGRRRRRVRARSRGERLTLLSLAAGLQLAAHDVRVGAEVVDEVAARIGDVGEEAGDEVEGIEGVSLLVVAAGPGQVRGGG